MWEPCQTASSRTQFETPQEKLFRLNGILFLAAFRVETPSLVAGALVTLAFLVVFEVFIRLFFWIAMVERSPSSKIC